ncbi:MAG: C45 family autoproteolytic acyltransferase/hydrolase [Chloroflexales bacterium]|nr:C45 family autoproteolytic acyltransferase/hydrolase [Chloroflexales bacterium]
MFPMITLTGDAQTRGREYGRQTAALVRHSIASYARLFAYRRGVDWEQIQGETQPYAAALADFAPDLLAEMQGIAEGADVSTDSIIALNARTELLASSDRSVDGPHRGYAAALARNRANAVPEHGECTVVAALPAATRSGATLLAQTWDWNGDQRAACVLLRIQAPGRPALLTLTEAGIVAKIGLNSAGVGVCLNILRSHADGERPGVPIHVLLRAVLDTPSVAAAQELISKVEAGASSCITLADAEGHAVSLEITPNGVGVLPPQNGLLAHTNHCVSPNTRAGACPLDLKSGSVPRYDRAQALLGAQHGRIDVAALQTVLRDHEAAPLCICRHPDSEQAPPERTESVTGVVMDLNAQVMYVAPGLPCQVAFTAVELQ